MAKVNTKSSGSQEKIIIDLVEVQQKQRAFLITINLKSLFVGGGILLLLAAFLAYQFCIKCHVRKSSEKNDGCAATQFEKIHLELLTNPGGGYPGFLDIMDTYSGTKAANLARYYSGLCYLHLGQYDAAIEYLKDYSAKWRRDCYHQTGKYWWWLFWKERF